jgi:hypothetical protein
MSKSTDIHFNPVYRRPQIGNSGSKWNRVIPVPTVYFRKKWYPLSIPRLRRARMYNYWRHLSCRFMLQQNYRNDISTNNVVDRKPLLYSAAMLAATVSGRSVELMRRHLSDMWRTRKIDDPNCHFMPTSALGLCVMATTWRARQTDRFLCDKASEWSEYAYLGRRSFECCDSNVRSNETSRLFINFLDFLY